jgi:zinc protease
MKEFFVKRYIFVTIVILSLLVTVSPQTRLLHDSNSAKSATTQRPTTKPSTGTQGPLAETVNLVNKQLGNGLEVIVLEDHSEPLVTVELAVRNGSYTEPPELNGLSHLYEHMFFKMNQAVSNKEDYLKNIGQLGITYNGETKEELVNYYFSTTSPNFPVALRFLRDSARYPMFDKEEFEKEREVVIGEIDRKESNPYGGISDEMNDRLFHKYFSRKNPIGNRQTVKTATTDQMRLIQHRYYVPNNSAIVITGDVKPEDVFRLVEQLFGDWERTDDPFVKFPLVEHPPITASEGVILNSQVANIVFDIGWQGPSIGKDDASTYAADVFSYILQQPDSRFQRNLVDSGLVAGIGFGYYTQRNVGPITLTAQTTPDKARAAIKAIYNEISHFNDKDYFTDKQLETAKALLESNDLYSREKLSDYTHVISFWWASTGLDYYRGYLKRLRGTSREDISRYLTTYIMDKPHVGLALLSTDTQKQAQLTKEDLIGPQKAYAAPNGK